MTHRISTYKLDILLESGRTQTKYDMYSCGQKGLTLHRTIVVKQPLLRAV